MVAPIRSKAIQAKQSIAIVGGGFTGSILAAHLLRCADGPTSVHLIERAAAIGTGVAYSTRNSAHLLNVRANNMSAFPDDPGHFVRWLGTRDGQDEASASGHAFVSRACYGAYVQDVLAEARASAPPHVTLNVVRGEVVDVMPKPSAVHLRLAAGVSLPVDKVALCVGHFPPSPPSMAAPEVLNSHRFIGDPWDLPAIAAIDPDETIMIFGTGLTMVDTVLTLTDQGHRGPIVAVSRRGLLPLAHEETHPYKSFLCPDVMPRTVLDVLIALKADVQRARADGIGWRSVFDALRPYHHRIWRFLPLEERRRFLRHARPYWEVHRHRMAPEVATRIEAARASGQLTVRAGRLRSLTLMENGIEAVFAERGGGPVRSLRVGAVINAAGPECDYQRIRHPLVRALLDRGLARPDALRLGLDVTEDGALIDADGLVSRRLFAFGPAGKAPFWEMTAVPELRSQCAQAARRLAGGPAMPLPPLSVQSEASRRV
ncbi:FAD/NAD(P)-binding protein [Azospirillum soli]|uniref:FAD/NAD(P)-binding protein n=1 Tax=Azospirillum soli TaxID=1304799 RepID=UPI001AEB2A1A|nr:FAD/NAD(P)-binding protein [Azospirillum soli]MBP2314886.1 putative NAD(P)/FAD-binding protein YdhS [Azospirillum soli]